MKVVGGISSKQLKTRVLQTYTEGGWLIQLSVNAADNRWTMPCWVFIRCPLAISEGGLWSFFVEEDSTVTSQRLQHLLSEWNCLQWQGHLAKIAAPEKSHITYYTSKPSNTVLGRGAGGRRQELMEGVFLLSFPPPLSFHPPPFPFPPSPIPFLSFPSPIPFLRFPSPLPSEVGPPLNQLWGRLGSAVSSPSGVRGRTPAENEFGAL